MCSPNLPLGVPPLLLIGLLLMLTVELITDIARSMATDEGVSFPDTFDAERLLTELNETTFTTTDDFEFLHDQGFALVVSISRELGI